MPTPSVRAAFSLGTRRASETCWKSETFAPSAPSPEAMPLRPCNRAASWRAASPSAASAVRRGAVCRAPASRAALAAAAAASLALLATVVGDGGEGDTSSLKANSSNLAAGSRPRRAAASAAATKLLTTRPSLTSAPDAPAPAPAPAASSDLPPPRRLSLDSTFSRRSHHLSEAGPFTSSLDAMRGAERAARRN